MKEFTTLSPVLKKEVGGGAESKEIISYTQRTKRNRQ